MDRTTALMVLAALAIGFLGMLVAGLLRSHAEILRQLHRLGVDLDPGAPADVAVALTHGSVVAITGDSPEGDSASVALDRPGERTLLLFLSSGCSTCAPLWDGLATRPLADVRVVVVTRDADEESPSLLAGRAPADVAVVMSSAAWTRFRVPGSPYAVLVEAGAVIGDGVARTWEQLGSLVGQHLSDLAGPRLDGAAREQRADEELLAAGIHPGHPSLYRS